MKNKIVTLDHSSRLCDLQDLNVGDRIILPNSKRKAGGLYSADMKSNGVCYLVTLTLIDDKGYFFTEIFTRTEATNCSEFRL